MKFKPEIPHNMTKVKNAILSRNLARTPNITTQEIKILFNKLDCPCPNPKNQPPTLRTTIKNHVAYTEQTTYSDKLNEIFNYPALCQDNIKYTTRGNTTPEENKIELHVYKQNVTQIKEQKHLHNCTSEPECENTSLDYVIKHFQNTHLNNRKHNEKQNKNRYIINFKTPSAHDLTNILTNVLLTSHHDSIQIFQGYCIVSGAFPTLVWEPQFKAYEKFLNINIPVR